MLLFGGNLTPELAIAIILAVTVGMTIHEFAHSFVAHLAGDPTPASMGRLTLNPLKHIYLPGYIMFLLIGFGILGTAPISPHRMRNQRWGTFAAVGAGPASNLLLATLVALIFQILPDSLFFNQLGGLNLMGVIFTQMVFWNVLLFVFNLIPVFPLDGWTVVLALLPPDLAYWWQRQQQTTQIIFFGLILLSFFPIGGLNILGTLITGPTFAIVRFLLA